METIYKTLDELGVPTFHPISLDWRRSYLEEVKNKSLIGKEFKTRKGKFFKCENIDKDYVYFYNIKMERKYAFFYLPTQKQLTTQEIKDMLLKLYPNSTLLIGKGCQLHGDVDATLILEDGSEILIPWNY